MKTLVIGAAIVDMVMQVDRIPKAEKMSSEKIQK